MKRHNFSVRFMPSGRVEHARDSLSILELAQLCGVGIFNTCNGVGTCGKCLVQIQGKASGLTETEKKTLSPSQIKEGWRLACQVWPKGDLTVDVPTVGPMQILSSGIKAKFTLSPSVTKRSFTLQAPTLEDQTGDYERACRELGIKPADTVSVDVLKSLSKGIRPDWQATALLEGDRLLGIEPGDTTDQLFGVAFDIGTTTLVGYLHDLNTGEELAVTSDLNPQVSYGADVISRIEYTIGQEKGLQILHSEVCNRMNRMIRELAEEAGIDRKSVYLVSVAGNSVMQHLFLNIDPRNIAFAPYIPVVQTGVSLSQTSARMDINPSGRVYVMPAIASYVGGDIVADILSTRLWRNKKATLLVDIGTNGEIVLINDRQIYACAAPAGPCFEGANITCGMRAAEGAIGAAKLAEQGDIEFYTVGNTKPRGICGSGLIDLVAILLKAGVVDETGRLIPSDELPDSVSPALASRVRMNGKMTEVFLVASENGDIVLTQADIRELQNAKGSIGAGIEVLCQRHGVKSSELDSILVAGAFGNFVRASAARRIGLLPQVPLEKIKSVGNAAGAGAQLVMLSAAERKRAQEIRKKVRYIELSGTPDFRDAYMDAMMFPEG